MTPVEASERAATDHELFGKRVRFTDREDWSIADVVGDYRSQHHVESGFHQMKDRKVVSFNPMFHWTDDKIRVHVSTACSISQSPGSCLERRRRPASAQASERSYRRSGRSRKPSCSSKESGDALGHGACSPRWIRTKIGSTTSAASPTSHPNAELGTTATVRKHRR